MIASQIIDINQKSRIISQKGSKKIRTKDQTSVLFKWLSFEHRRVIGFASICYTIVLKISRRFLNQSQVKAKSISSRYL